MLLKLITHAPPPPPPPPTKKKKEKKNSKRNISTLSVLSCSTSETLMWKKNPLFQLMKTTWPYSLSCWLREGVGGRPWPNTPWRTDSCYRCMPWRKNVGGLGMKWQHFHCRQWHDMYWKRSQDRSLFNFKESPQDQSPGALIVSWYPVVRSTEKKNVGRFLQQHGLTRSQLLKPQSIVTNQRSGPVTNGMVAVFIFGRRKAWHWLQLRICSITLVSLHTILVTHSSTRHLKRHRLDTTICPQKSAIHKAKRNLKAGWVQLFHCHTCQVQHFLLHHLCIHPCQFQPQLCQNQQCLHLSLLYLPLQSLLQLLLRRLHQSQLYPFPWLFISGRMLHNVDSLRTKEDRLKAWQQRNTLLDVVAECRQKEKALLAQCEQEHLKVTALSTKVATLQTNNDSLKEALMQARRTISTIKASNFHRRLKRQEKQL